MQKVLKIISGVLLPSLLFVILSGCSQQRSVLPLSSLPTTPPSYYSHFPQTQSQSSGNSGYSGTNTKGYIPTLSPQEGLLMTSFKRWYSKLDSLLPKEDVKELQTVRPSNNSTTTSGNNQADRPVTGEHGSRPTAGNIQH